MRSNRFRILRALLVVILALMGIQFELGMIVNMSDPQAIPPFRFSLAAVSDALRGVGPVALVHAAVGGLLVILSVAALVLALSSRVRGAQIFGGLATLSILFAATGGLSFVLSGFQNDGSSHSMATNFLLTFTFYFVEIYVLKPVPAA